MAQIIPLTGFGDNYKVYNTGDSVYYQDGSNSFNYDKTQADNIAWLAATGQISSGSLQAQAALSLLGGVNPYANKTASTLRNEGYSGNFTVQSPDQRTNDMWQKGVQANSGYAQTSGSNDYFSPPVQASSPTILNSTPKPAGTTPLPTNTSVAASAPMQSQSTQHTLPVGVGSQASPEALAKFLSLQNPNSTWIPQNSAQASAGTNTFTLSQTPNAAPAITNAVYNPPTQAPTQAPQMQMPAWASAPPAWLNDMQSWWGNAQKQQQQWQQPTPAPTQAPIDYTSQFSDLTKQFGNQFTTYQDQQAKQWQDYMAQQNQMYTGLTDSYKGILTNFQDVWKTQQDQQTSAYDKLQNTLTAPQYSPNYANNALMRPVTQNSNITAQNQYGNMGYNNKRSSLWGDW
jgi:hypothetical protein